MLIFCQPPVFANETENGTSKSSYVRYVSDNGEGNGRSPENTMNSIEEAVAQLSRTGGVVVIVGESSLGSVKLQDSTKAIYITSFYDGIDYRSDEQNAVLKLTSSFSGSAEFAGLTLGGELRLEYLNIECGVATPAIFLNYNNFSVAPTVSLDAKTYSPPFIYGGFAVPPISANYNASDYSSSKDQTVIINGGRWSYVRGGNRRASSLSAVGVYSGDMKLSIGGGVFTARTGDNFTSLLGMNSTSGSVTAEISGGLFYGSIYIQGRVGDLAAGMVVPDISADITLSISGGDFVSSIEAVQGGSDIPITGNYFLNITGGKIRDKALLSGEGFPASKINYSYEYKNIAESSVGFSEIIIIDAPDTNDPIYIIIILAVISIITIHKVWSLLCPKQQNAFLLLRKKKTILNL
jgi:hypothetical protein